MSELIPARGVSIPKPGQTDETNADCWGTMNCPDDATVAIHVVCDGVSAARIGRGAARTACQHAIDLFKQDWNREIEYVQFLEDIITNSHKKVRQSFPNQDAACTMVAAIVIGDKNELVIGHAGDSMAYLWRQGVLKPLTSSHTQAFVPTRNGEPILQAGVPVMGQALSRYIGQPQLLEPEISKFDFESGDVICLTSDGIPKGQLCSFLAQIAFPPSEQALAKFCKECSQDTDDDATVLLQQLGMLPGVKAVEQELANYDRLAAEQRDALLGKLLQMPQVDSRKVFQCLEKEDNQDRALTLVKCLSDVADEIKFDEWLGQLNRACDRQWRDLRDALTKRMRKLK